VARFASCYSQRRCVAYNISRVAVVSKGYSTSTMICHGSNHIAGGGVAHRGPGGAACARAGWGRVELRGGVGVKGAQKPQTMGV
jgi:hypothetical protein